MGETAPSSSSLRTTPIPSSIKIFARHNSLKIHPPVASAKLARERHSDDRRKILALIRDVYYTHPHHSGVVMKISLPLLLLILLIPQFACADPNQLELLKSDMKSGTPSLYLNTIGKKFFSDSFLRNTERWNAIDIQSFVQKTFPGACSGVTLRAQTPFLNDKWLSRGIAMTIWDHCV